MSQTSFVLDDSQSRTVYGTVLQASFQALASNSSGLTEPTTTYAYQLWYDTTSGLVKERNSANSAWIVKDVIAKPYTIDNATNDFRLSMVSGNPNPINSSSGSVYMTPYIGNTIALYDTTNQIWDLFSTTQIAISVSGLNVGSLYDVFAYNNGVLGVAIQTVEWTNTTTRATALAYKDGVLVKTDNYSRRYLGTFLVSATNVVYDTPAFRHLYNFNNRLPNNLYLSLNLDNTYGSTTKRQFAGSATAQLEIVNGIADQNITLVYNTAGNNLSTGIAFTGIGQNSTSTIISGCNEGLLNSRATVIASATAVVTPAVGKHYFSFIQYCSDTNSTEFIGAGNKTLMQAFWMS
jgi:hypothetical protein